MNILMITNFFGRQNEIGARRNNLIAQGLTKHDFTMTVLHINAGLNSCGQQVEGEFRGIDHIVSDLSFITRFVHRNLNSRYLALKLLAKVLNAIGIIDYYSYSIPYSLFAGIKIFRNKKIDLILTSSPSFICPVLGLILSKIYNIPHVSDNRDLWASGDYNKSKFLPLQKARLLVELVVHKSAAHVLFTGKFAAQHYTNQFGIGNVSYMYSGASSNNRTENTGDRSIFVHAGSMYGGKRRLDIFLDAILELGIFVNIFLIGPDVGTYKEYEKKYSSLNIVIMGLLTKDKSDDLCEKSYFSLILHGSDDFDKMVLPGKFFEFLTVKKPIICIGPSDSEIGEIIRRYRLGVCSLDKGEIAYFLKECIRSEYSPSDLLPGELTSEYAVSALGKKIHNLID